MMKYRAILSLVLCLMFRVSGQETIPSSISGTVTDDKGSPRAGAVVMLMRGGLSTTTDEDGNFTLEGDAGVKLPRSSSLSNNEIGVRGGKLYFTIFTGKTPVRVELFDCRGRLIEKTPTIDVMPGRHYIAIGSLKSKSAALSSVGRITIGQNETTFRVAALGNPPARSAPILQDARYLAKTQAVVDTLLVSDFGYLTVRTPITEYTVSSQQITILRDNRVDKLIINDIREEDMVNQNGVPPVTVLYEAPGGDSGTTISFFGKQTAAKPDFLDVDFVQFSNPFGRWPHRIVYSREFLPINWAIDSFTVVVFSHGQDSINPYETMHAIYGIDTAGNSDTLTMNLHPGDLHAFIGRCKAAVPDFDTMPVRDFFAANGINHYNDLLHLAYTNSPQVAYHRYLCVVFSTAQACMEMQRILPARLAKRMDSFGPTTIAGDLLKVMLKHVLKETLRDLLAKPPSGIGALLCESADETWDECKYEYVRFEPTSTGAVPSDAISKCMKICTWVTLGCFTNICMPMTLEEAEALDLKQQLANFDQQYFGGVFTAGGLIKAKSRNMLR